jgi:DNA-binding beta-propeller fold protein YncE
VYTDNKKYMAKLLLVFLGLILPFFFNGCSQKQKPRIMPNDMVWPSPPDVPRIKLVASISSEEDVGGPKKRSFKDILLGKDPRKNIIRLRQPYGICVDSQGKIYVADSGQGVVVVFDREIGKAEFLGHKGRGKLAWPIDVTIDSKKNIYVSDARHKNILTYHPDGTFKSSLVTKGTVTNPAGMVYDKERDRILVVDSKAHDVKVFSPAGKLIAKFGGRGVGEGRFNFPTNIAIGGDGYVYIVDTGNHRVQVFDKKYEYYDDFGTLGVHPGQFRRPRGIALDSENHIYIIDAVFSNFQIFNQEYQILMPVGRYGRDFGQFWLPAGIYIDRTDKIYVVDTMNKRIQIFQYLKQESSQ